MDGMEKLSTDNSQNHHDGSYLGITGIKRPGEKRLSELTLEIEQNCGSKSYLNAKVAIFLNQVGAGFEVFQRILEF